MKMLRKILIVKIVLLVLVQSSAVLADCKSDCDVVISKADKLIRDLKEEISLHKQLEADQQKQIVSLSLQNDEKGSALASPLRNPVLVGGVGILVGIILTLVLHK